MRHTAGFQRSSVGRLSVPLCGCAIALAGCALAGGSAPGGATDTSLPDAPPIRIGLRTEAEARAAVTLLTEGEELLREGSFAEARERAEAVERDYPEATGSSLALWLGARAAARLDDWPGSRSFVERYLEVVGPVGPYYAAAVLLHAEALWETGSRDALDALLAVPSDAGEDVLATGDSLAIALGRGMETSELSELIAGPSGHPRFFPSFVAEMGVRRYLAGAEAEGRALAERALAMAPGPSVAARARSVVEGRVEEELPVSARLGAILTGSGAPTFVQLSQAIREGVELALAEVAGASPLSLASDAGDPARVALAIQGFERTGAVGVVGPLVDPLLEAAARSRTGLLPIVSPTAATVPDGLEGVFSLGGVDPEAGRALAALVSAEGMRDVVVLHPSSVDMFEEAGWFRQALGGAGGPYVRTLTYPVGTTGFGPYLEEVIRLIPTELVPVEVTPDSTELVRTVMAPAGLVVLLSPGTDDVELLAPQISFYGVREIQGLQLFGSESWTESAVLEAIQPRHTDGVLAVTSWPQEGEFGPAWPRFVAAYEGHFQQTLRSPTAALGYDAARLLLTAARLGGGVPSGTLRALREIRDFAGATGVLSVVDDRIVRRHYPVRIESRRLVPLLP